MEIFKLFGSIFVDNEKANESISATDKKAQGLGAKLGEGIKTAAKWGAAITAGAVAGGTALFGMATKAMNTLDRIDKLSQKIGISRDAFQTWEYVLSQSGTDIEKMQVGLKTMVQRMDETAKGTGQGARMFEQLGVSVMDSTGALRKQEDVFNDVVMVLSDMPEGAEKSRLAFELFGKAGMELMPLLNSTSGDIEALKERAHDLGLVLSDEAVDAGVLFQDTMDDMKRSLGAVFTQVGAAVIPIFQELANWVLAHMPEIKEFISNAFEHVTAVVTYIIETVWPALMGVFQTAYDVITAIWTKWGQDISGTTTSAFDIIKDTVQTVLKVVEGIIKIFGGIMTGDFEMIKDGVLQAWNGLWDWIKNMGSVIKDIGHNIITSLWEGMKGAWSKLTSWVGDKVQGFLGALNPFKGGVVISGPNIPAMATGGTVLRSGMALVGEAGPELLHLPKGAQVMPLGKSGVTININGANIMDDYGVDRMMDRVVERLALLGVS